MNIVSRLSAVTAGVATAAVLVTGCGSSTGGAAFTTQSGVTPDAATASCLVHQKSEPTVAYTGGAKGTTVDVLTFLAYYTANGNKRFCDGKPAGAKDKTWAKLYASYAEPKNVAGIIGG